MAMNHGCYQSIINLGYIWEYGRTGERDYQEAYQCYALAAALADSGEAAYKLGDMYSRGKFVERDMAKAYQLWSRSLDLAEDIVEIAQPAIRIAQLLLPRTASLRVPSAIPCAPSSSSSRRRLAFASTSTMARPTTASASRRPSRARRGPGEGQGDH
ncbi:MAG: hypothetical protein U0J93_06445 [Parolsenella sp.]|uniref:tetratricopeptide repeat protein n=1 Tax=Parolsenella sp. TaxID=2083006 RepID=UPI002E78F17F|nr:hypothetical protein [Parolsenella sp.]MEE1373001.1 hypothetical protein [Parolsenella sp.]